MHCWKPFASPLRICPCGKPGDMGDRTVTQLVRLRAQIQIPCPVREVAFVSKDRLHIRSAPFRILPDELKKFAIRHVIPIQIERLYINALLVRTVEGEIAAPLDSGHPLWYTLLSTYQSRHLENQTDK